MGTVWHRRVVFRGLPRSGPLSSVKLPATVHRNRRGGAHMAGRLAVIGSGLMGSGIAQVAAQAGWQVTMRDLDDASLTAAWTAIRESLGRFAAKGKIEAEDVEAHARPDHHRPPTWTRRPTPTWWSRRSSSGSRLKHEVFRDAGQDLQGRRGARPPTPRRSRSPRSPRSPRGRSRWSASTSSRPVPMMKLVRAGPRLQDLATRRWPPPAPSPRRSARPASRSSGTSPASSPTGCSRRWWSRRSSWSSPAWSRPRTWTPPASSASGTRWARWRPST